MTELLSKKDCRDQQKARLKALAEEHPDVKVAQEERLYRKLFSSAGWRSADTVALTKSLPFEVNTDSLIQQAWLEKKTVLVARVAEAGRLDFVQVSEKTNWSKPNRMGLVEPLDGKVMPVAAINLMIVPALAFDCDSGQRLGFGGGYYDRVLKDFTGKSAALCLAEQARCDWIKDDFDQVVQEIIN
ncbi:5-formyltetrahydrofolate cyclo-ligase [Fructobacillus durionis]|uniref:5-formyltetrahydrofolate cyclo-ligase n=1 Tax=Fructobacillus durionis TaxID=283737 RepID=A0A1I1EF26_9LACO|nr:5-formyltetrahydrofolate cyclo-ligase [Fructobacillus durionis]